MLRVPTVYIPYDDIFLNPQNNLNTHMSKKGLHFQGCSYTIQSFKMRFLSRCVGPKYVLEVRMAIALPCKNFFFASFLQPPLSSFFKGDLVVTSPR